MKKVVGIIPLYDEQKDSYWMLPGYTKMLEREDAVPMILPLTEDPTMLDYFLGICGGFIFPGGQDVDPALYNAEKADWCGDICEIRDKMEFHILNRAIEENKAVLGICRGLHFMNACYGGTLYQDIDKEHPSDIKHLMKPPYNKVAHKNTILKDTPLYNLLQMEEIGVNSNHHQAVKDVSPDFEIMSYSEDGLVEGIYMPDKRFVWGIQWHPEFVFEFDKPCQKIVKAFVKAVL